MRRVSRVIVVLLCLLAPSSQQALRAAPAAQQAPPSAQQAPPAAASPVTLDQVRLLERDNVVSALAADEGLTLIGLGVLNPKSVDSIVPAYLERFKAKGQYSHYRV